MKKVLSAALIVLGIIFLIFFISMVKAPSPPAKNKSSTSRSSTSALTSHKLFLKALELEKEGELLKARDMLKKALGTASQTKEIEEIQKKIENLNMEIIFSPLIDKDSFLYEVKPGDSLAKIAKKFGTTVALIKRSNHLRRDLIRAGEKLKIIKGVFSLVIDKSQNLMFLKENGEIINTYLVSTGRNNSTPTGTFKIINKLKNPVWFRKDIGAVVPPSSPDNILGSRWLGLDIEGYGIHGTTKPQDLGKQVTAGCIRMRNSDIEELYDILPLKTKVVIVD